MIVIGLTGSIGMGKTAAAAMLRRLGVPVHEADDEVHELLSLKGRAYQAVAKAFPHFEHPEIYSDKNAKGRRSIIRGRLGEVVFKNDKKRKKLESILHPHVREAQADFIRKQKNMGRKIVALDIPLLFETGGETRVDYTMVVTAPYSVQRQRVLARPGMDTKKFRAILERQMPDGEKRARADYVIHTGLGRAATIRELKAALRDIKKKNEPTKKEKPKNGKNRARIRARSP